MFFTCFNLYHLLFLLHFTCLSLVLTWSTYYSSFICHVHHLFYPVPPIIPSSCYMFITCFNLFHPLFLLLFTCLSFVLTCSTCTTHYSSLILHVHHLFYPVPPIIPSSCYMFITCFNLYHPLFLVHFTCLSFVLSRTTYYSFFMLHVYHLF